MLVAALESQAEMFDVQPRIVRQDSASFLRASAAQRFDLVFLDPPYALPRRAAARAAAAVAQRRARSCTSSGLERPGCRRCRQATWLKRSHAGAVEYGLLRFGAAV